MNEQARRHTLMVLDPGHFHAALVLRERHPRLDDDVYVYAEEGPELGLFLDIVESFNRRPTRPTDWRLHVYRGADHLDRLLAERPGDFVVVAGKNHRKMASIDRLHRAGLPVLCDKPWLIDDRAISLLGNALSAPPPAMDIMTERHETAHRILEALTRRQDVVGTLHGDVASPAIVMTSIHHLSKTVNGKPLRRPAWYFDIAVQGTGVTDVTTHLVDLTHWIAAGGDVIDHARDVEFDTVRQWSTAVPRDVFARVTGLADFPAMLRDRVDGDTLDYLCNATLNWRVRGVHARVEAIWALEQPAGGRDEHHIEVHGSAASLFVDQDASTDYVTRLTIAPAADSAPWKQALDRAMVDLQPIFAGISCERLGSAWGVLIPDALRTTHEQHFAAVLDEFLDTLDTGSTSPHVSADLMAKYTLLGHAARIAGSA